jgi:hypothetical protein
MDLQVSNAKDGQSLSNAQLEKRLRIGDGNAWNILHEKRAVNLHSPFAHAAVREVFTPRNGRNPLKASEETKRLLREFAEAAKAAGAYPIQRRKPKKAGRVPTERDPGSGVQRKLDHTTNGASPVATSTMGENDTAARAS